MKRYLCFLLIFTLFPQSGATQTFDRDKLDALFDLIESKEQGMGSLSIFKDGQEVYQRSIGYENVENEVPASVGTKYRIGSISKSFTAAIILQLVEEGKLTLDGKLSDYFPQMPNASKITVEHLLRHRSGLYNFTNSPAYFEYMQSPKSKAELLDIFIEHGTVFEPDEKFEYSNTNYVLLAYMIEEVEGRAFGKVFEERITLKLGLANTYYGGKIGARPSEAQSYRMNEGWQLATETDMSIPSGAGAIVSTPTELNKFFDALFNGQIINEQSLEKMTKVVDGYGMGLFQIPFYERKAMGHNGGIDGFQSNASYFESDGVGVAYVTNGTMMGVNDILIGVLSIYFGKQYEFPSFAPAIELASEELDKYLGVYSSAALPMKITISKRENRLFAQATGQSEFPLEAFEKDKFRFDPAGIKIEFLVDDHKFILNQGGGKFEFEKEE